VGLRVRVPDRARGGVPRRDRLPARYADQDRLARAAGARQPAVLAHQRGARRLAHARPQHALHFQGIGGPCRQRSQRQYPAPGSRLQLLHAPDRLRHHPARPRRRHPAGVPQRGGAARRALRPAAAAGRGARAVLPDGDGGAGPAQRAARDRHAAEPRGLGQPDCAAARHRGAVNLHPGGDRRAVPVADAADGARPDGRQHRGVSPSADGERVRVRGAGGGGDLPGAARHAAVRAAAAAGAGGRRGDAQRAPALVAALLPRRDPGGRRAGRAVAAGPARVAALGCEPGRPAGRSADADGAGAAVPGAGEPGAALLPDHRGGGGARGSGGARPVERAGDLAAQPRAGALRAHHVLAGAGDRHWLVRDELPRDGIQQPRRSGEIRRGDRYPAGGAGHEPKRQPRPARVLFRGAGWHRRRQHGLPGARRQPEHRPGE